MYLNFHSEIWLLQAPKTSIKQSIIHACFYKSGFPFIHFLALQHRRVLVIFRLKACTVKIFDRCAFRQQQGGARKSSVRSLKCLLLPLKWLVALRCICRIWQPFKHITAQIIYKTVYFTIYELVIQLSHFVKLQIELIVDVLFLPDWRWETNVWEWKSTF